ncbi:MAG TPA: DegT/DnrJ/EryC1/StrS family aminotransferase, partial [Solirubrobacteraceae bacterium]
LQAAILRVQLPHLDGWADARRQAGAAYEHAGLGELVKLSQPTAGSAPAWHLYVVGYAQVERLEAALAQAEIGHKPYYRTPIHRQPPMREWARGVELPATEEAARTHLAIPMSPVLSGEQVDEVVAAVRSL